MKDLATQDEAQEGAVRDSAAQGGAKEEDIRDLATQGASQEWATRDLAAQDAANEGAIMGVGRQGMSFWGEGERQSFANHALGPSRSNIPPGPNHRFRLRTVPPFSPPDPGQMSAAEA